VASRLEIIISAINKASGPIGEVGKSLDTLDDKARKAKGALGPINDLIGLGLKTAVGIGVGALGALGVGLTKSIGLAMDMEQGVANIASIMGLTRDEVQPLKDLITQLGLDPNLVVTATEAASAIEMLAKNGLPLEDILGGAARASILLSNATGADFATSADVATDAMALFGMTADQMERAVAGIVAVTQQSKFGVEEYKYALANAAPVLSRLGITFDEFNAAITMSASSFASGMTAGTSWRYVIQNLIPNTDKAAGAMKELGLITEDGTNKFFDQSGKLKSLDQIILLLQESFGGLTAEQQQSYARVIFGQEALGALGAALDMNVDKLRETIATQSDVNKLNESAATRTDTLKGALGILGGQFEAVGQMVGDKFLPHITDLTRKVINYMDRAGPQIVEWAGFFADELGKLSDRYMPVILAQLDDWLERGPELADTIASGAKQVWEFMKQVRDIATPILNFISNTTSLKGILTALGVVMVINALASVVSLVAGIWSAVTAVGAFLVALSPVTLVVGAIALAIYGLYVAWQNNFLGIRDITAAVWEKLKEWFGHIVKWFSDFPATLTAFGRSLWEKAQWVIGQLGAGLEMAKGLARAGWDAVVNWLSRGRDERSGPWGQSLWEFGKNSINKIREGFENARDGVKTSLQQAFDWIDRGRQEKLPPFQQNLFNFGRDTVNKIREGFENARDGAKTSLQQAFDWIDRGRQEKLPPFQQALFDGGKNVLGKLGEGFNSAKEAAKSALGTTLNDVKEHGWGYATGAMAGRFVQGAADALRGFGKGFSDNTPGLQATFGNAIGAISTTFNDLMDDRPGGFFRHATGRARDLMTGIGNALRAVDLWGILDAAFRPIINVFDSVLDEMGPHAWSRVIDLGGGIVRGLARGIRDTFRELRDALEWIVNIAPQWVKDRLGIRSPSKVFAEIGKWIPPGLAEGISDTTHVLSEAMDDVMASMVGSVTGDTNINNSRNNTYNVSLPTPSGERTDQQAVNLVSLLTSVYS
jgi:TP901 family phage tail tape measure protein